MIIGLFKVDKKLILWIVVLSLGAAAVLLFTEWNTDFVYYDMLFFDNYAIAFSILLIFVTILIFLLSENYFSNIKTYQTEHYSLFVFALVGMISIVSFDHLAMLFIGIEIMSICLYILAGSDKKNLHSNEASLKYFLMGAFATGLLLMGITMIYGATGSFHLDQISDSLANNNYMVKDPIFLIGLILMLAGLAFKVSAAPFHFWTPDVYQGSPTLVTAFMGTAVKVAGFGGFLRLFYYGFLNASEIWINIVAVMAVATIIIGSISAVFQTNVKRILAYSSISHAGYMLVVFLTAGENTGNAMFFYAIAYSISSIVAFSIFMAVQKVTQSEEVDSFNGFAKSNPFLAFVMALAMISLAGIPLTGGFFAKFYILYQAMEAGYLWIVIIAIINAIVGMYYYFKIIIAMYFKEGDSIALMGVSTSGLYKVVLVVCSLITLQLGLFPDLIYNLF